MALRVTHDEVAEILDTNISDVTPFITVANLVVTDKLSGEGLSSDLLKEIERWLSAHFVSARDPRIKQEKTEGASVTYTGNFGKGLDLTPYGQNVKLLDSTGILAKIGMKSVTFHAVEFDVEGYRTPE